MIIGICSSRSPSSATTNNSTSSPSSSSSNISNSIRSTGSSRCNINGSSSSNSSSSIRSTGSSRCNISSRVAVLVAAVRSSRSSVLELVHCNHEAVGMIPIYIYMYIYIYIYIYIHGRRHWRGMRAPTLPPTPTIFWSKFFFLRKIRKHKVFLVNNRWHFNLFTE